MLYQPRLLLRQTRPSNAYCITTTRNILRLFIAADALTLSQHLGLYEIIAISIYRPNPAIFAAIVCSNSASTAGSSSRPGRAYSSLNNASKNRSAAGSAAGSGAVPGLRFQIRSSAFSLFPAFDFVFPFPHSARFRAIFLFPRGNRFSLNAFSSN